MNFATPPQKRLNVMKSLTALSKYLGCYEEWANTRKQYNLKWTTGSESLQAMERFFNPEMSLDNKIEKVKEMIRVLLTPCGAVVRLLVLLD
jgi:hypothetical protein